MDACKCIQNALLAGTTFLSLAYFYGQWKNTFFHEYGIPGPHPEPYLGNIREIRKKGFREVLAEWMHSFGDVYGFYVGNTPTIFVKDLDILKEVSIKHFQDFPDRMFPDLNPGIVRHGVLFSKGDAWRRQRAVMAPTFSGGKLDKMGSILNDCADALVKRLRDRDGDEIVLRDYFGRFTLEVIVKAAFGLNTDTDDILYDNLRKLIRPGKKGAFSHFSSNIFPSMVPLLRILGFSVIPKAPYQYILRALVDAINLRKLEPKNENKDFIQLLIDAETMEIPNASKKTLKRFGRRGCENQRELSVHSFVVETDDVGCEFISMAHSESTKNHPGGFGDSEYTKPRVYATGTPLCPVVSFRKYMSKLNPENEALFQQPRKNVCENDCGDRSCQPEVGGPDGKCRRQPIATGSSWKPSCEYNIA
ncbi:cytochrome P450 3A8-like [Haliotis rubra]|uniref:cytochrome P450 3A8-like n=1 Tax=Haliotis rubra TaxID=36100 RepID=UPI001EE5874C|nr:cytochrome P450 3A8-like [Haliotis rubra]